MISINRLFEADQSKERKIIQQFLNKNKDQKFNKITIECNNSTAYESLIPLLTYIQSNGNCGHSFEIIVDPNDSEFKRSFGFDGDGAHYINKIKLNSINIDKIIKDNK